MSRTARRGDVVGGEDGEDGEDHIGYPRVLTILLLERLKLPVAVTDDDIEHFK